MDRTSVRAAKVKPRFVVRMKSNISSVGFKWLSDSYGRVRGISLHTSITVIVVRSTTVFFLAGPLILMLALMSGCSSLWMNIYQTIKPCFERSSHVVDHARLNPDLHYLKVDSAGNVSLWVEADQANGDQVWISSDGGLIKTHYGRLSSTGGFKVNWLSVSEPNAQDADFLGKASVGSQRQFERVVSMSFPLAVDMRFQVSQRRIVQPREFKTLNASALVWVEETALRSDRPHEKLTGVYGYQYAIDRAMWEVVAARQCLDASFCIRWQRLNIKP
jgi:hypothetical protein